eukprot:COSAG01_NODE_14923_length_1395_cov_1.472222_3_plen_48_part_01
MNNERQSPGDVLSTCCKTQGHSRLAASNVLAGVCAISGGNVHVSPGYT